MVKNRSLTARESVIALMKFHIKRSHDRIKSLDDKHRSDRDFKEEAWVYLKLQPYRQATIRQGKQHKLSPKYSGPFLVKKKISSDGLITEEPFAILDRRMARKGNAATIYVLIQLVNGTLANATWESYDSIAERFPHFNLNVYLLEDKQCLKEEALICS
ncbi:hypothetical protein Tco_0068653 [Tanacetum coccineum]